MPEMGAPSEFKGLCGLFFSIWSDDYGQSILCIDIEAMDSHEAGYKPECAQCISGICESFVRDCPPAAGEFNLGTHKPNVPNMGISRS